MFGPISNGPDSFGSVAGDDQSCDVLPATGWISGIFDRPGVWRIGRSLGTGFSLKQRLQHELAPKHRIHPTTPLPNLTFACRTFCTRLRSAVSCFQQLLAYFPGLDPSMFALSAFYSLSKCM